MGHPPVPGTLAAPQLAQPVVDFTMLSPSAGHVFGMTRFPDDEESSGPDPVAGALEATASNYRVAFFEDRRGRGMNYNLVIEVGAMLMAGRRCLLLKDSSIDKMPTVLVGHIYKPGRPGRLCHDQTGGPRVGP